MYVRPHPEISPELLRNLHERLVEPWFGRSWRVTRVRVGRTYRGYPVKLIELQDRGREGVRYAVGAAHPETSEVFEVKMLEDDPKSRPSSRALPPQWRYPYPRRTLRLRSTSLFMDFGMEEQHRSKGIGSLITAHALEKARRLGRPVRTPEITDMRWLQFLRKIGAKIKGFEEPAFWGNRALRQRRWRDYLLRTKTGD
jgi:GNAT superfamily N-acetyltransferase